MGWLLRLKNLLFQDILFVTASDKLFNLLIEKIDKYSIAMGEWLVASLQQSSQGE